jgi:CheY-like chemotaxis protein
MSGHPAGLADLKVLYVDDDPFNLRVVSEMLRAVGVPVDPAASGAEALERLSVMAYDLILMDIHMPNMSGPECLVRIRQLGGSNRETPVIAVTADLSRQVAEYRRLGFDAVVFKPISLRTLLAAVLTSIQARPSAAGRKLAGCSPAA